MTDPSKPEKPAAPAPRGPSRQGLAEYVIVTLFLAIAAAGAVAIFGDELRDAFGVKPPPAASSPAAPSPAARGR